MLTVTKIFDFAYAHYLPDYPGKCAKLHGHTGILEVELTKSKDFGSPYPDMVIDFSELKKVVEVKVLRQFDHKFINDEMRIPTAENMVEWIVEKLQEVFPNSLIRVRLYETPDSYAEWRKT